VRIHTTGRPKLQSILGEGKGDSVVERTGGVPILWRHSSIRNPMATTEPKPTYEQMSATIRRARLLLRMNQADLCTALNIGRQTIAQIEQTRRYPSRKLVDRFAQQFQVNLYVYDWAREPANADGLPGLLGLVPLHIVRLYERRLIDASVRDGRSRPLRAKSSPVLAGGSVMMAD
jgi:transcriptional regulator with XRE-family HTH domain